MKSIIAIVFSLIIASLMFAGFSKIKSSTSNETRTYACVQSVAYDLDSDRKWVILKSGRVLNYSETVRDDSFIEIFPNGGYSVISSGAC